MKFTYFVNSMFLIKGKNSKVLCDPWITTGKKSRSGLYNYPELEIRRKDLPNLKSDYIYLSYACRSF